jgi:hypothetical protein
MIDKYYSSIIACVKEATDQCIPSKCVKSSHFSVAGWNDFADEKHKAARNAFLSWVADGKPRHGYSYEIMKITRAKFKLAMRYCRSNEERLKSDALARDHLSNNSNFWKRVKNEANSKATKFVNCVHGVVGEANIANMWKENYEKLYNTHVNSGVYDHQCKILLDNIGNYDVNEIMYADIGKAMSLLKSGKACGPDGIYPESLKYGGQMLAMHLTFLFNMLIAHSYLPASLTMTTLVPLLKNKSGDIADVNNYRAIALSNATSKIIECVMLERFQAVDQDGDPCQFGFRKNHSTTLGCSVLKDVIDYYRVNGSYVFTCFLDMSKAFDMVNHHKLFDKLIKLNFPTCLVKLLIFWYSNQLVNVRWRNTTTCSFIMKNGTRQGSILSPFLFSVYMRDISATINKSGIGCHLGGVPCNILFYADDMVILAPSWRSLQALLDLGTGIVHDLDMKFNASKSVAMIFKPVNKSRRLTCEFDNFVLCNDKLKFVTSFTYLGHLITDDLSDDDDMMKQLGLLYGRTNMLIRKFTKCSVPVKKRLFKTYCISFFGMALWKNYRKVTGLKIEAAYVKCIKMFFCYDRLSSVRQMFIDLGLPSFNSLMHNTVLCFNNRCQSHENNVVSTVRELLYNV